MESMQTYLQTARELWTSEERRWLVSFRSPLEIWSENPTFLALELVVYCWAFLSLKHGKVAKKGMHTATRTDSATIFNNRIM